MGLKYLWDTNTVIYFLQQQFPPEAEQRIDSMLQLSAPCISAITEIELLSWKSASEKDLEVLTNFIEDVLVIELEKPIKRKAAEIRREHQLKLGDAIIAATAIFYGFELVTRNSKDFRKVQELKILDPFTA